MARASSFHEITSLFGIFWSKVLPRVPIETDFDFRLITRYSSSDSVPHDLILRGSFEAECTILLFSLISEGMVCVDLGANIGYYTVLMSKLVGSRGRVYAVEPDPSNLAVLVSNVALNGCSNVIVVPFAVSDYDGEGTFYLEATGLDGRLGTPIEQRERITTRVAKLDSIIPDGRIDFVKADIQGCEPRAMSGGISVLASVRYLLTEFSPDLISEQGSRPEDFLDSLLGMGFFLYRIRNGGLARTNPREVLNELGPREWTNLLAIARSELPNIESGRMNGAKVSP